MPALPGLEEALPGLEEALPGLEEALPGLEEACVSRAGEEACRQSARGLKVFAS